MAGTDPVAPGTAIDSQPGPLTFSRVPRVAFSSDSPSAMFECSVDDDAWEACSSPLMLEQATLGRHVVAVRAVANSVADTSPAVARFRVADTLITRAPERATFERRPETRFRVAGGGKLAKTQCSFDGKPFRPCQTPLRKRLGAGVHRIAVRGAGAGAADPSPARTRFRIEPRRITFGRSVSGRPLRAFHSGDPAARRTVLVAGSIHGDEPAGRSVVARLKNAGNSFDINLWLIDTVNPDGAARGSRTNAHGVDLNRNFSFRWTPGEPFGSGYYPGPKAFSEPESRAVARFTQRIDPDLSVWYHQPWGAVLACGTGRGVERHYARVAQMKTSCQGNGLPGTAVTWQEHELGGRAFVVELPAGGISATQGNRHLEAIRAIA